MCRGRHGRHSRPIAAGPLDRLSGLGILNQAAHLRTTPAGSGISKASVGWLCVGGGAGRGGGGVCWRADAVLGPAAACCPMHANRQIACHACAPDAATLAATATAGTVGPASALHTGTQGCSPATCRWWWACLRGRTDHAAIGTAAAAHAPVHPSAGPDFLVDRNRQKCRCRNPRAAQAFHRRDDGWRQPRPRAVGPTSSADCIMGAPCVDLQAGSRLLHAPSAVGGGNGCCAQLAAPCGRPCCNKGCAGANCE